MKDINILLAGNNAYAFNTQVFLISLLENSRNRNVHLYFLYNDFSEKNMDKLNKIIHQYNASVDYLYIDKKLFGNVPIKAITNKYITIETYFRMAMVEVLPSHIDKILYLDTDIIINQDYSVLYDLQLSENVCAYVCNDYGLVMNKKIKERVFNNLNFSKNDKYFNAGVMLLNLKYIRKKYSLKLFLNFISEYYSKLTFHDQDVLNALFKDHVKYVDYNFYNCRPFFYPYASKYENWIKNNAVIIHYGEKPWNYNFTDLAGDIFWKYARKGGYEFEYLKWKKENRKYQLFHFYDVFYKRVKRNLKLYFCRKAYL